MSEPKQGPKILLHKPKKNQRSSPGASAVNSTSQDAAGGTRSVSTASGMPPTPPDAKKPWTRFRTALTALLVVNAVVVGYTLFRTSFKPSEPPKEGDSDEKKEKESETKPTEVEKEKKSEITETESVSSKSEHPVPSNFAQESKVTLAPVPQQQIMFQGLNKPKLSDEQQQELFKWALAEKRKVKPTSKAEKAQIDAEKALLKEFLRSKRVLDV